jgi:outer membrane murein-binding lipoprotein Lpp
MSTTRVVNRKKYLLARMEFRYDNIRANESKIKELQAKIRLLNEDIKSDQRTIRTAQTEMARIENEEFDEKAKRGAEWMKTLAPSE